MLENGVILLMGSPLSGKGTQGNLLGKTFDRPYVSSGDLFRDEVKSGSDLGQEMKKHMESGELIPNQLTKQFLINKLSQPIYQNGIVLDGYPRNISHLPTFEQIFENLDEKVSLVIYLNVSKLILEERRKQRNRNDDEECTFQRRYSLFQEETLPLIELFKSKYLFIEIQPNSHSSIEQIHQQILQQISELK